MLPLYPLYWVFLITDKCWILLKVFSVSIEIIIWFLSFILLMWCSTLINLQMLNHPCIPWTNPTWSRYMILLCIVAFGLLVFGWGFLHLCTSEIPTYFLLCVVFIWFWHLGDVGLVKWVRKYSLLLNCSV